MQKDATFMFKVILHLRASCDLLKSASGQTELVLVDIYSASCLALNKEFKRYVQTQLWWIQPIAAYIQYANY